MNLSEKVKKKLQTLPSKPGVYLMRDKKGKVIYIGKATSLRSRVRTYFRQGTLRSADPKLRGLIKCIDDFDFIVVRSEAEATITEGRFIKEYKPRYNTAFRDDKRFLLLKINLHDPFPRFNFCRIQKNDAHTYFGPYASAASARIAKEFVDKRFGLRQCRPKVPGPADHKHCLNDIIRTCSAPCILKIDEEQYQDRVEEACAFLRGERPSYLKEIEEAMQEQSNAMHFEKAAALRDTLLLLRRAMKKRIRGTKDLSISSLDAKQGVLELQKTLDLENKPNHIECFDISNISGTYAVASMVCSVEGFPRRNLYRRFRIKTVHGIDDPGMMKEAISRRYSRILKEDGIRPDLILVDGGITQLKAAQAALRKIGLSEIPIAGLAKRFEEIYWQNPQGYTTFRLPRTSNALKMLQRIRDEAHRFALTYHRKLRSKRIRESVLDDVPGIGEKRKEILLNHFGSITRLKKAGLEEIMEIPGFGKAIAELVKSVLDSGS